MMSVSLSLLGSQQIIVYTNNYLLRVGSLVTRLVTLSSLVCQSSSPAAKVRGGKWKEEHKRTQSNENKR
jgi:hypothetical protein